MTHAKQNHSHALNGIIFTCLFALSSYYIASLHWIMDKGISPLVIAVVLGIVYGSTLRHHLPQEWTPGIQFVSKRILRLAIVFYGFRLTFQQVMMVGLEGFILDVLIVGITIAIGGFIGIRLFKLDRDTALLISSGAGICGAAAVLATEGVLKSEAHKAAVAIISVVLFGTTSIFLYPFLQHSGWLGFNDMQYGIYAGASIHEVAQALVAGTTISPMAGNIAVIVKMTRVMMLAPTLIILAVILRSTGNTNKEGIMKMIPWFAVFFILVVGFNSLQLLPNSLVDIINQLDTFLLTLAMAALGIETNFNKVKQIGLRPLYFSVFLYAWLVGGGYILCRMILH